MLEFNVKVADAEPLKANAPSPKRQASFMVPADKPLFGSLKETVPTEQKSFLKIEKCNPESSKGSFQQPSEQQKNVV